MSAPGPSYEAELGRLGAAGAAIVATDWSVHPLGPVAQWPDELLIALRILLSSAFPSALAWGPELHVFYNDAYAPLLEGRPCRAQGTPLAQLWGEAWTDLQPIVARALAGDPVAFEDQPFEVERFGRREAAYFTFSYSPVPGRGGGTGGVLSTLVETTATVLANIRLTESEERLQMALRASGDIGIWSYDPTADVVNADARAAAMFGLDPSALSAGIPIRSVHERIHPDDRAANARAMREALGHRGRYETEYRVPQREGQVLWVASRGCLVGGGSASAPVRFTGVLQDVTARKQAEEEARQANARKDEFLAMLAHELRNPLAPIRAAADLLSMQPMDEGRLRLTSAIISRQVTHMTGLVDDLLDVSRVSKGLVSLHRRLLDPRAVTLAAVEQARPLLDGKRHHLSLDLGDADEAPWVLGDENRLVQVMANLLTNAARYTPPGGHVDVRLRREGGEVSLVVADDGVGMDAAFIQQAFELFTQGARTPDRAQGGLGIGLALVRSLVAAHGGSVRARSDGPGTGCTFEVRLPAATGEAAGRSDEAGAGAVRASDPARVLIVDDNADAATMLALFLESLGYRCTVENDSRSALETAARERPEVCLLDVGLPDMDGNALASRLRASPATAHSLLVAVTGYGEQADRDATARAGFDHHLVKPVDTARLADLIASRARRTG